MDLFETSHFSHDALLHDLKTLDGQDRRTTAVLVSRVVEVEERRLFLREGYPSMHAYCVDGLHWCEGTASRRIYGARAARSFPVLFDAVADGRLHLTAVLKLFKHLTSGNVDELVAAATHKSKAGIQQLIAERFPQPDLPELLQAMGPPPTQTMTAPQGGQYSPENAQTSSQPPVPAPAHQCSPENTESRAPRTALKPLAPQRFGFQCTLDQETYDLLQRARALTGHQNPKGEIVPVLKRALELLVGQLEKQKFAATTRPGRARGRRGRGRRRVPQRPGRRSSTSRHASAARTSTPARSDPARGPTARAPSAARPGRRSSS